MFEEKEKIWKELLKQLKKDSKIHIDNALKASYMYSTCYMHVHVHAPIFYYLFKFFYIHVHVHVHCSTINEHEHVHCTSCHVQYVVYLF